MSLWIYPLIFALTLLLTELVRRYAIKHNVIDIANERSSHTNPTPRGGGLGVVIVYSITIALLAWYQYLETSLEIIILFTSLPLAIIGFIDDHAHVSAKVRIVVHILTASTFVLIVGGVTQIELFDSIITLGIVGTVLTIIGLVWLINLYNFMDGIDGLAAIEAITATFFAGVCLYLLNPESKLITQHWLFAASICGFLLLNFPKAKIFMGDVGSGFIGFMLGVLMLLSYQENEKMLWVWLILLSVFIVDATLTLTSRLFRKKNLFSAHNEHLYQKISNHINSHLSTSIGVLSINVFILLPLALSVVFTDEDHLFVFLFTYVLIMLFWFVGQKKYTSK
ncbi:glycosyltransferase family 4 protein [Thalassotalea psychrophila]|uniref:Glycosyltransferase family 4 protein n=1 Tax=Thalassotalea psychrophila TaxID=3065647 RepID=A0ABY9TQT9_9GAMM|nr:glycosyltransferase family 4 protein [Colwelliaceae bacterium SQ149]